VSGTYVFKAHRLLYHARPARQFLTPTCRLSRSDLSLMHSRRSTQQRTSSLLLYYSQALSEVIQKSMSLKIRARLGTGDQLSNTHLPRSGATPRNPPGNSQPQTPNHKPQIPNLKPQTPNPKPKQTKPNQPNKPIQIKTGVRGGRDHLGPLPRILCGAGAGFPPARARTCFSRDGQSLPVDRYARFVRLAAGGRDPELRDRGGANRTLILLTASLSC